MGIEMASEMDYDTDEAGSRISSKKKFETAAEKETEENESEVSSEGEIEGAQDIGCRWRE